MTLIQAKTLLAHTQIASAILAAIGTAASLRIENGSVLTKEELARLDSFFQQQLAHVAAEVDSARRLVELANRSGKGDKP